MVVYKVLKSKVKIDLAFFLTLVLFSLVTIGKEIWTTQTFLQPEQKKLLSSQLSTILKIVLKILDIVSEKRFLLQAFEATINLAPMGVLCSLSNQYKIGSSLSSSVMFRSNFLN